MWQLKKEDPSVCHYFGNDRHNLRTFLESKNRNEEEALWEFLTRSARYLAVDPKVEIRMFPLKKPSFPLTPIEVFQKVPPLQRRKLFFKSLERGDIFYLKVILEKNDCFKLLALDKYKGCMKIDDLGIVMDLPKLPQELKHLFPHSFSVIRAALSSCNIKERSLCVTLDKSIVKPEYRDVYLGPVYEGYNLHYHGNPFLGISFTDNLFMTGQIRVRNRLPELSILGIKEKTEYSHYKKSNKRVFSPSLARSSLKERLLQSTSSSYYQLAVAAMDDGRTKQALSQIKQALYIWNDYPEALVLAGKCYNIIGDTPNAFISTMDAFESYPSVSAARKYMCVMLVDAAKVHLSYNDKSLAREFLEMARIIDPDDKNSVRLLKQAKLLNRSSMINPDEKYVFPFPFEDEVDVGEPEARPKKKHKRKSSKKKHEHSRHQKHHKSSKLTSSPKKSTSAPFKSHTKSKSMSQFSEPPTIQKDPFESQDTIKVIWELVEKLQAESRLKKSMEQAFIKPAGVPNLSSTIQIPHRSHFAAGMQSTPNIAEFTAPQPIQTSTPSTPEETLKSLYELAESAKLEIQRQNQMKMSKLMQPASERMASEDSSILNTIISTTSKLLSITQDLVKNSPHSSIISENLPLLQSHLLSNQLVPQYPVNQGPQFKIPRQIECAHPSQTFLTNPLCLNPENSHSNLAHMFALENSGCILTNNSLMQSNNEGRVPVEPTSESHSIPPHNIPFLEYPTAVSTPGHSNHSFPKWPANPNCTLKSDSLVKQPNTGSQIESIPENQSMSLYKDSLPLSKLKTKYFKPLSPGLNQSDSASSTKQKAENVPKNEAPLPVSTNLETQKRDVNKSPEISRRTPQRYRLTPPKKQEKVTSKRNRSRSPRRREGGHSRRRRDRSPKSRPSRSSRRSRSPRRRRSRSYSSKRYRSKSIDRSRSRSRLRSRSNSLKRSKCRRSRSGSPVRYRRKVHLGTRSPSPPKSSPYHFYGKRPGSSIPRDSSTANLCEVVVSSPSFSDSSPVSYFETRSPSPHSELRKDFSCESPFLQSSPDVQNISLVGFHRSQSPPWKRHVSITTKPNKHKVNSSSTPYQSSGGSKESSFTEDRPLSPPKQNIPVICSRSNKYV